eukprot:CAMPEP_0115032382 /NCGR_PEP_ID=MMETSP0216-20121206/39126_1 /TAXON_ID=223996 /ORGANISM="Protocruzia adherens, Strain Boccale" /LENGTH=330 /DNA_ID=CAMNT_0002410273 /DNA_START=21 /DNA_END=1013 /DNA_ORIENTATION=-
MKAIALALIPILLLGVGYWSYQANQSDDSNLNLRPIIAVMAQPAEQDCTSFDPDYTSYIAASYIQFVEGMGARAVPVRYDDTDEHIQSIIEQVDGALFPGGATGLVEHDEEGKMYTTRYYDVEEMFFKASIAKKEQGINFPIMATCLGFESVAYMVMKNKVLDWCSAPKIAMTQTLVNPDDSFVFGNVSEEMRNALETEKLVFENHERCVTIDHYNNTKELNEFFRLTSTAVGVKGNVYVNSWEAKDYPIFGQQYHPEKNIYEWQTPDIPHSALAVQWTQYLGNVLADEARRNPQKFLDPKVEAAELIYNYEPLYTDGGYFEEVYCFKKP